MKYKELYTESQKVFEKRLHHIQCNWYNVRDDLTEMGYILEARKDEMSPELYSYIQKELYKIERICYNNAIK